MCVVKERFRDLWVSCRGGETIELLKLGPNQAQIRKLERCDEPGKVSPFLYLNFIFIFIFSIITSLVWLEPEMVIIAFEFYLNGNFYFKISLISYKHCRGLLPNQLSSPGLAPMTEETSCGCIYLLFCLLLLAPRPPLQLLSSGNWIQFCNLGRKPVTFTTIKTNGRKEKNEIFSSMPALTYFPRLLSSIIFN